LLVVLRDKPSCAEICGLDRPCAMRCSTSRSRVASIGKASGAIDGRCWWAKKSSTRVATGRLKIASPLATARIARSRSVASSIVRSPSR